MLRVGIVGVSGYSGGVLLDLLIKHENVRVTYVSANDINGPIENIRPHLKGRINLPCKDYNSKEAIKKCDLIILAVPHTVSMMIVPDLMAANKKVIDLSADYRFHDAEKYKLHYKTAHRDKKNLPKAIYGLPELSREDIKNACLLANPGCYPTAAILALAPIISIKTKSIASIAIDAKSGVTGAGRKVAQSLLFAEVNESVKTYKILQHQHAPEIDLIISKLAEEDVSVDFVPHLVPINRGILETIYVRLKNKTRIERVIDLYSKFYKKEQFVRIFKKGQQPELKNVVGTNFCDLGFTANDAGNLIVITSAIDNLMKGASGQAVQNMNLMCGFKESMGLL